MKNPIQSNPIQPRKVGLKFLLLMLSLFCFHFANSQPPPESPPGEFTDYPFDNPVVFDQTDPEGTIRFETINNTECSAEFHNWFHVGLRNKSTGAISPVYTDLQIPFVLGGGQSGSITNYQLFEIWQLPEINTETHEYVILSTGVYLKFGGMSGYMALNITANGTTILVPGNNPPCDCFIFHITSNGNKITLTLDPCS